MHYLVIANILVWVGIGGYLLYLGRENRKITQKLNQIQREFK